MSSRPHWIEDYLHAIIGYSEDAMEQCVVRMASQKGIKSHRDILEKLTDDLSLPRGHPKLEDFCVKLFNSYHKEQ